MPSIHSTVPVIATDDISKSVLYYTEVLGFELDFQYGDPVTYAGVIAGEAEIYFSFDPCFCGVLKKENITPEIFVWISQADHLYSCHVKQGANIIEPIADRPWGARQYVVRDINGYYLKFAQAI